MKLSELNALDPVAFVATLGEIYEHSPWVAERLATGRPFNSKEQLSDQMKLTVNKAGRDAHLALIRSHPDLAGKLAISGQLSDASSREQAGIGLDRLKAEEFTTFSDLNRQYREKFGFPFIICVRKTNKAGILTAFRDRLKNSREQEIESALREIHEIAELRLQDLITAD